MNGTVIFGGVILFFIISGLITFVNELHDDVDTAYMGQKNHTKEEYKKFYDVNMYGEMTVVLTAVPKLKKREVWRKSLLFNEVLELFPNFTEMKSVVEKRLIDNGSFKNSLLEKIVDIEQRYIGGVETGDSAKLSLSQF